MQSIVEVCRGKWPAILTELGVPARFLKASHGPCPICGGRDRFRFDDREGRGTWICSKCGAGDGFTLLQKLNGWDFVEAKEAVLVIAPGARKATVFRRNEDDTLKRMIDGLWTSGFDLRRGDPVSLYLSKRGIKFLPKHLRYVERCRFQVRGGEPSWMPAMVAKVTGPDGAMVNAHRTYITIDGNKADVVPCRKMMPGNVPNGSAIRLWPETSSLGIAEGIETAISAAILFKMPVWSVINTSGMMGFVPPIEVSNFHIFADNDRNFAGQSAAYSLAHRLRNLPSAPSTIEVHVPETEGTDWNDVLIERSKS
jgi:putative DNA primase/helicase